MFEAESCGKCHTPPLSTDNELVRAPGFRVPDALLETEAITRRRVGTDPALTMTTRRGTGFYKVPGLRGVCYRGPFTHGGAVRTLEDWLDPRRLRDDYLPAGWNPRALIAFLRTR